MIEKIRIKISLQVILQIVFLLLFVIGLMPVVKYAMNQYFYYSVVLVCYSLIIIENLKYNSNVTILFLALVLLFSILYYLGQDMEVYSFLVSFRGKVGFFIYILGAQSIRRFSIEGKKFIWVSLLILIIITNITTIVGLKTNPDASRFLAFYSDEYSNLYSGQNIGGYGFVYSLLFLFPLFIYCIRCSNSKFKKSLYFCVVFFNFYVIVVSQYTICLLLSIIIILVSISLNFKNKEIWIFFIFMFCVLFYIVRIDIGSGLIKLAESMTDLAYVSARVLEMGDFLKGSGLEGDSFSRISRYKQSIDCFLSNPIIGSFIDDSKVGGHSTILDILGSIGLFGFALFVLLLSKFKMTEVFSTCDIINYSKLAFSFYIILSLINTTLSEQIAIVLFISYGLFDGLNRNNSDNGNVNMILFKC